MRGAAQGAKYKRFLFVVVINGFELFFNGLERDFSVFEDLGGNTLVVFENGKQDMLGADILLMVSLSNSLCEFQDVFSGF